ncbi:response regulator [Aquisalimonas sp.]|uniref:response regulator n=1 Tax=Aquisalimonas sp. TaxID=1872621 RepID=UPI0025C23E99|nr:response regulator [Aquisalimonas sp.]
MSASADAERVRILVIEDEPVVAMGLAKLLDSLGFQPVGPVASIDKALHVVERGGFDGALLDVNLRGEWAAPVVERLAANNIPIVLTTGYDAGALPAPYCHHPTLSKPFRAAELTEALAGIQRRD